MPTRRGRSPMPVPDEANSGASSPASPAVTCQCTSQCTSTSTLDIAASTEEVHDVPSAKHGENETRSPSRSSDYSKEDWFSEFSASHQDRVAEEPAEEDGDGGTSRSPCDGDGDAADAADADDVDAALNAVLLSRLECPVCYQPMAPPIRQCVFGHSVCSRCEARLARCPTCRGDFLPAPATNATLNAIALAVRLPCRNHHAGCRMHLHLGDKARHEDHCPFRGYRCPHTPPPCKWEGTLGKLMEHTLAMHPVDTALLSLNSYTDISYAYSRPRPFEVNELEKGVNRISKTLVLVELRDEDPLAHTNNKNKKKDKKKDKGVVKDGGGKLWTPRALFRFHLRFDAARVSLQAVLQYVGPPANSKLFRYKVSIGSIDASFSMSAWSEATSEEVDDAVLRMDSTAFRHVIDEDGRFSVRIKVVVGRLPPLGGQENAPSL